MIAWLLITGLLSGAGGEAAQQELQQPAGARRPQTYAQAWAEHERYQRAAQAWLDSTALPRAEPNTTETSAPKKGRKIQTTTQVAQVAPSQPRTAEPAPFPRVDTTALQALLRAAEGYRLREAQLLQAAMDRRELEHLMRAAWEAGVAVKRKRAQDDEAVAVILLLAA